MKHLCVYCGARTGGDPSYAGAARAVGAAVAREGAGVVYGGGSTGLMGAVADGALEAGGNVIGVIPGFLDGAEVGHQGVDLRVTSTMHERKQLMETLSDAFVALPGGYGTLDELFEILTWRQLSLHEKPVGLLNHQGYFTSLLSFLDHAVGEGLLKRELRQRLVVDDDPARLVRTLLSP